MRCPECKVRLVEESFVGDAAWRCPRCSGRVVPVAALQRVAAPAFFAAFQRAFQESVAARAPECAACHRYARPVTVEHGGLLVAVDVCVRCRLVWFEANELAQLPTRKRFESTAIAAARRELATAQARRAVEKAQSAASQDPDLSTVSPGRKLLAWFGVPVEAECLIPGYRPLLTLGLGLALVVAFLATLEAPMAAWRRFGFVPAEPFRSLGLTPLTAFFLHGGFAHLLGNLAVLLLVGDDLEERFGRLRLALLLVAATLLGALFHTLVAPSSTSPCIGASGGIAGLMAAYTCAWPRRQIVIRRPWMLPSLRWRLFGSGWRDFVVLVPAWTCFALWLLLQFVLLAWQFAGLGSISAGAHLGGAVAGLLAHAWWRSGASQRSGG